MNTLYLGYPPCEKQRIIADYQAAHGLRHTVVICGRAPLDVPGADCITYDDTIMYVTFYRLLQEIGPETLVVVDECLRSQDRNNLYYNCIRHYLNQTRHVLIFQHLPQIDTQDDFMALFDFATGSRWKRHPFDLNLILDNVQIQLCPHPLHLRRIDVPVSSKTYAKYQRERQRLFADLGYKDPHTLPRNLYLIGGADKLAYAESAMPLFGAQTQPRRYVARNQRLRCDAVTTHEHATAEGAPYTILEFPHRFLDFSDFLYRTYQTAFDVLVADLKVDRWYFDRYTAWKDRLCETQASLSQ